MEQNISFKKIDEMRVNILKNLKLIESNKHLIRTHDKNILMNYHNFILNTFDNMINILKVENADPYAHTNMNDNLNFSNGVTSTVLYNIDGTSKVINKRNIINSNNDWERQFDENIMNPPCYSMPPQSLTYIPKIKNST